MYIAVNEMRVRAEDTKEFETGFAASMDSTLRGIPGLRRSTLVRRAPMVVHGRQQDEPDDGMVTYQATMEFESEDAYQAYLGSDSFRAAHGGGHHLPIVDSSLRAYESVHEIEP